MHTSNRRHAAWDIFLSFFSLKHGFHGSNLIDKIVRDSVVFILNTGDVNLERQYTLIMIILGIYEYL